MITSRILGLSSNAHLPLPAVWAVTGKNLQASTEIAERTYRIRLDPQSDVPGDRTGPEPGVRWRHPNLRGWFTAHRGEIIHAWLTIIQGWISAGRPLVDVPAFGSFEQWTQIVGSILAFCGNHDVLTHREEAREAMDNDKGAWRAFIDYWVRRAEEEETEARAKGKKLGPGDVTLRQSPTELVTLADLEDSPDCPADLSATTTKGKRIAMGMALEKIRDQRFGDYILKTKRSNKGSVWYLQPVK